MARKKKKGVLDKMLPESAGGPASAGEDQPFTTGGVNAYNDRRINNVSSARELFERLYLENQGRANSFSQIRNQIEGGRPFDPAELVRNGESSWRSNVNFNDARAAFNRTLLPFWKMINEVPRRASIKLHSQSPHADEWGIAMAEAFDMFLDDWGPDYLMNFMGVCHDYIMFGPGFAMWPDARTPRYKWAQTTQILFPKRTKMSVDNWELVAVRREMTADELVNLVRDQKEKKNSHAAGWNTEAVMQAIKLASPGPNSVRYFDPNYWQDMIVANDLVIGGVWPPVAVVDLWATSRDGKKIRHYIFTEQSNVQQYLYEADEEADTFRKIFAPVYYGVGANCLIHSIKGFGVQNYYYATAINRTKCRALDSATFAMGMNFVKSDNTPDGTPPVENVSMLNIFPMGLQQLQWYPSLKVGLELIQSLKQAEDENNFVYNEVKDSIAETDTATQGKLIAAIGAEMGTATSSLFLAQIGTNFFTQQFDRLVNKSSGDPDAVKFRERCKRMGVPDEAFDLERTVKTGASPMMASPAQRLQVMSQARAMLYNLPGANRRWLDEQTVATLLGADAVNKALLPDGAQSDPAARRQAMMENVDLGQGLLLPVAPEDAHVEHIDEHLKPLEAIVQAAQSGQQIGPDHLVMLQITLPHIGQHLQFLQNDETKIQQFREAKARVANVGSVAQGLMARLSKAHQNGAQRPEIATALRTNA
jgi:hypothetical protein